ncbi:MAG TPA: EamA family transporter [Methanocorpusculum sp.]|nr:EamA family transporter [Methanocorpusculum sp.]HJJ39745.1 EamA family transporter [Methanocorpusculum sp.]HJJ49354.1 EamA family transporter [Methanocorpusculum sp.]HJJ56602.1 EamA family transporter [Methanocorpusculum sp.]
MKAGDFLFPILVFLGGCAFGPSSSLTKLGYLDGFSSSEMVMSQYFFGVLFMMLLTGGFFLIQHIRGNLHRPKRPSLKTVILLILAGISIALVSATFMLSLQTVPAHISVILLFQYTWMGVILDAVISRKLPSKGTVISVIILILSTLLAAGVGMGAENLNPVGVLFGILSAVFYAVYIFVLGKIDPSISSTSRSLLVLSVALLTLIVVFSPSYFTSGILVESNIWFYGLLLGSIGCALPSFLFSIATPKIPAGASVILSSSELPASIICSVIIISDHVTWLQWIGIVLLFFGIAFPYLWDWVAEKRKKTVST